MGKVQQKEGISTPGITCTSIFHPFPLYSTVFGKANQR